MPKQKIDTVKINKVPLQKALVDKPQVFSSQPILYLELIENKARIQQELIGKTYKPPEDTSEYTSPPKNYKHEGLQEKQKVLDRLRSEWSPSSSPGDSRSHRSPATEIPEDSYSPDHRQEREISERSIRSDDSVTHLSVRLKSLLDGKHQSSSQPQVHIRSPSRSPTQVKYDEYQRSRERKPPPPTLEQLQQDGAYQPSTTLPQARVDSDEDLKRELIFKFELLKKSYKSSNIPEFTIHSNLDNMQKTYDMTVRRLNIDSSVESYKTYLIGGFMLVEFVLGKWLKLDMEGFTKQQILGMNNYEKLLIELGEKSYVPEGSQWPVELRLLFLVIIQAAFFLIGKMIMKKTGANLMSMMNSHMQQSDSTPAAPKRRMRSPSVNLDDLPEL